MLYGRQIWVSELLFKNGNGETRLGILIRCAEQDYPLENLLSAPRYIVLANAASLLLTDEQGVLAFLQQASPGKVNGSLRRVDFRIVRGGMEFRVRILRGA